ncbi:hypothetical protein AB0M87_31795 [Streptomyces sp. NPDC051320]|uniref:hypothetical protein n=1 Tax=Streptomyces sp. NPDC051320 TaxID=3154644 RepID=UPI003421D8E0
MTTEISRSHTVPPRTNPSQERATQSIGRSDNIHVRWVMPEVFHDLPVAVDDDDEAVRILEELTAKALPGVPGEEQLKFGVLCALGLDDLVTAGAEYAAICVLALDETPCSATVFTSLVDSPDGVANPIRAIAASLRRTGSGNEVTEIELPCGLAVSCVGTRQERVTGELADAGLPAVFATSFIRVYVPLPNGTTFVMEMDTPTMTGWDTFATLFGNIASSIRLFNTDGSALITARAGA